MVSIASLWVPILVSAVLVFIISAVIHMILPYHRSDFKPLPNEADVMDALRPFDLPPGDYAMPYCADPHEMKSDDFKARMVKGPVALMTVHPTGPAAMGRNLFQWFVFCLIVSVLAAYVAGRAVRPGGVYLEVFRFAGCAAFVAYSVALWQDSIWYRRSWMTTLKSNIDGLIYGLVTAGVFGWLWPR